MGRYLDEHGRFKAVRTRRACRCDVLTLSFHDHAARPALWRYAEECADAELADDIRRRLRELVDAEVSGR